MKTFTTTLALALLAALYASVALAASGSNTGRITTLLWYEGHSGLLIRQEGMTDLAACGRADYYIVDDSNPRIKDIYAMLMLAYTTENPVSITVSECTQGLGRVRHVSVAR